MAPDDFLTIGNGLFSERYVGIVEYIHNAFPFDEARESYIRQSILRWAESQAGFAQSSKDSFESQLLLFPEIAQGAVRSTFPNFDAAHRAAVDRFEHFKTLSTQQLIEAMGL